MKGIEEFKASVSHIGEVAMNGEVILDSINQLFLTEGILGEVVNFPHDGVELIEGETKFVLS